MCGIIGLFRGENSCVTASFTLQVAPSDSLYVAVTISYLLLFRTFSGGGGVTLTLQVPQYINMCK